MWRYACLVLVVLSVGCATQSPVQEISPEVYKVTWTSEFGPDIAKMRATELAVEFAATHDLAAKTINAEIVKDKNVQGDAVHTCEITFKLIAPSEVEPEPAKPVNEDSLLPQGYAPPKSASEKLLNLKELKDEGLITDEEFLRLKAEILKAK